MYDKNQEYINPHAALETKLYLSRKQNKRSFFKKFIDKLLQYFL